ncbi:hypothetical protein K3495_g4512 [Podosphaera aphanis]|nr:hypothetical protein K3495_g4512 [Podosphaera aphanis]
MRMLLAFAALNNSHIRHFNITAAFLHADIDRQIYIGQPHRREKSGDLVFQHNIAQNSDGIRIGQQDIIETLCEDMNMVNCKGANTPVADDNLIDFNTDNSCSKDDAALYRSAIGTLLHIANMTRPDIQYAVNRLCRYIPNPSTNALLSPKHLIWYVSRSKSASLFLSSRGTSGILFFINGFPIAWWSKKQTGTVQSTCEAEYAALTTFAVAAQWIRPLYEERLDSFIIVVNQF